MINKPVPTPDTLASPAARTTHADPGLLAKRRARIRDFEIQSLDRSDPLEAVLGACASDLMYGMLDLREGLDRAWGQESDSIEQFSQLLPCLDQLGKMSKQLESLVELHLSIPDRRLLTKELRLRLQKVIRSKKKKTPIVSGIVSPADRAGPLVLKPKPKKPR